MRWWKNHLVLGEAGVREKGEQWEWFGGIGRVKRVNARFYIIRGVG